MNQHQKRSKTRCDMKKTKGTAVEIVGTHRVKT